MKGYYAADNIARLIRYYGSLPRSFNSIDRLMRGRQLLSMHLFNFAEELAQVSKDLEQAEYIRKSSFARYVVEFKDSNTSAALAEKMAENKCADLRSRESGLAATHASMQLIYRAGKDVLDVMGQHISNLKAEKKDNESTGFML